MKGLDIAVVELAISLGEARALGLAPLAIDPAPPSSGDTVTNVAIPAQGLAPSDWVLRRGQCTLGPHGRPAGARAGTSTAAGPADCPGVRGGSSGSPVLGADGSIVGLVNTTTAGTDPVGGDCYLDKPCERTKDGTARCPTGRMPSRSGRGRLLPARGLRCRRPGLRARPRWRPNGRIDERAIRPDPALGAATTSAVVDGPAGIDVVDKVGPAGSTDCADPVGYGRPARLDPPSRVTVEVPAVDGMYVYCVAAPDDVERAALAVIQVDSTPPRARAGGVGRRRRRRRPHRADLLDPRAVRLRGQDRSHRRHRLRR